MINLFLTTTKSMFYRTIWMLFVISSCVFSADKLHRLCSAPFRCGDQSDLSYPFWIPGREACGHPEFKLECNTSFAELGISSVKFRILEADYTSGIIRLARSDYIGALCPLNPLNAPFNKEVLPFSPGTDMLTIYYKCPDFSESVSTYIGDIDCEDDNEDYEESYYVTRNLSSPLLREIGGFLDGFRGMCKINVSIPASGPSLITFQNFPTQKILKKVLKEGFEVGVNRECSRCIYSEGACGYNQSSSGFVCYCIDGRHNHTCGSGNKAAGLPTRPKADAGLPTAANTDAGLSNGEKSGLSTGAKAGIGTASASGLFILVAVGLFCLISRKRKTQAAQPTSKGLPIMSLRKKTSSNPLLLSNSNLVNRSIDFGVQVFTYEELEEATENFSRELGEGGFGTVYYGLLKDGRAVAVKRLYERSLKRVDQFKNEVEILKSLKHPNLVILYGCTSRHSRELLLVYEYISNGTLADHLHGDRAESRPLSWSVRLNVAIESASALSFLHASGIIHRDVKTTNILLDENYTVKVADFGLSRLFPVDQTHVSTAPQGTPGYVDPEYFQCYRLNEKSDVYSFGVVLVELISSKEAVDVNRHSHDINLARMAIAKIHNNALHELVDPSLGFESDSEVRRRMMSVAELAFRCLQQEREVRPSMDEIVKVLRGIKEQIGESPEVVDIGGDDVGMLRHNVPPPISPENDTWTSSSEDMEAIPF
ncbi:hypothetical protein AALP_AA2G085200 [Arabis alpina]|uniref:non-specific serine/threonine protein kinase n=1 Tax=Arabis alpina TaxID=50452 RepID=A0A087HG43_ARAAL|nr:hypothetical protein AALP_AA2G085200 [Arabis alpina]